MFLWCLSSASQCSLLVPRVPVCSACGSVRVSALQPAGHRLQPPEFRGGGVWVPRAAAVPPAGEGSGRVAVSLALLLSERRR